MKKKAFIDLLKVRFLIGENAFTSWSSIFIVILLFIILIYNSHSVYKKVFDIEKLNNEVKELKGEFVEVRSTLQRTRLESSVKQSLELYGLRQSDKPPQKIKVIVRE